jgi:hypothetical protein
VNQEKSIGFTYNSTKLEFLAISRYQLFRSFPFYTLCFVISSIFASAYPQRKSWFIEFLLSKNIEVNLFLYLFSTFILLFAFLISTIIFIYSMSFLIAYFSKFSNPLIEISINENGISYKFNGQSITNEWKFVDTIKSTRDFIHYKRKGMNQSLLILPRRVFGNIEAESSFISNCELYFRGSKMD